MSASVAAAQVALCLRCRSFLETAQNEWNHSLLISSVPNCGQCARTTATSSGHSVRLLWPPAVLVAPSGDEGRREPRSRFSWLQWKKDLSWATESHHGSVSVSTPCWIIASFLLDLCYVWVWRRECEGEQKLRVILYSHLLRLFNSSCGLVLYYRTFRGWLDVGHMVCFIGQCGELKPNCLLCSWTTIAALEFQLTGGNLAIPAVHRWRSPLGDSVWGCNYF